MGRGEGLLIDPLLINVFLNFQILRHPKIIHGRHGENILELSPVQFARNGILPLCKLAGAILPNQNEGDRSLGEINYVNLYQTSFKMPISPGSYVIMM